MSESVIAVHLSGPVLQGAMDRAARDGVSVEDWLRALAEHHIRETNLMEKYFSRRPEPGDLARMREILNRAPDVPPMPGDELPEGWSPDELRSFDKPNPPS